MGYEDTSELIDKNELKPYLHERRKQNLEMENRLSTAEAQLRELKDVTKEIKQELRSISQELTKYKGMVGGALFILSSLLYIVPMIKAWILNK